MNRIVCRLKVADACYDGRPTSVQFGEDLPMSGDGTFDGVSIACDACYAVVLPFSRSGRGLTDELGAAANAYVTNTTWARNHANPQELVDESRAAAQVAREGSPRWRSALACLEIARAEVERRREP